tara:strand:+ start:37 stop:321 length:285 start_codon:yes stop_codon:yes gene_type:complete
MKKITLSVAALSLAISGFCTNPPTDKELIIELSQTTEDMIKSMRVVQLADSIITSEALQVYTHNLLTMLSKLEDLHASQIKKDPNNGIIYYKNK